MKKILLLIAVMFTAGIAEMKAEVDPNFYVCICFG